VKTSPFVLMISMLLALPVHAQQFPETERQKAQEDRERAQQAHKKAKEQEIDEDYRSLMERTPSVGKKADPWGNLRAPSSGK
jgi:septal ring factor EnvC (AmiA/AmiB activator)